MTKEYFREHLSLSDWLIKADVPGRDRLVREDATKRDRLSFLSSTMRLPIVHSFSFRIDEVTGASDRFAEFCSCAGGAPYALRALPRVEGQPILRNRKLLVPELVTWLLSLNVDLCQYDLSFEPHIDPTMATLFVVGDYRVFGEAAHGSVLQLNKGTDSGDARVRFEFDYQQWHFSGQDAEVEAFVRAAVQAVQVPDQDARATLETGLKARFRNDYLCGYFEVVTSLQTGPMFIDYNRVLIQNARDLSLPVFDAADHPSSRTLRGQGACRGVVKGCARVVSADEAGTLSLEPGQILVCHFTSPSFVPLITQASAVVTDIGGVLSHAAIVCRELGKTCVVGAKTATSVIRDGQEIEVDGDQGIVRIFEA